MSKKIIKFKNCRILRRHALVEENLWVSEGKIVNPEKLFYANKVKEDIEIDVKGDIISPGFIDLQVNGGYGFDFTHDIQLHPEGINMIAKRMLENGVTSFCPTLVTTDPENYHKVLPLLSKRQGGYHGAEILGAHVEGPFLNLQRRGAHKDENIADFRDGARSVLKMYQHLSSIKLITLDPELPNSTEVIKFLVSNNIVVSIGHTQANYMISQIAIEAGARMITHIFNAMRPFHHREPGSVGLLGSPLAPQVYYTLIPDGTHLHSAAIRLAYTVHPEGAVVISDSTSATGTKEGIYYIGDLEIEVRGKIAYVAHTNIIAGSVSTFSHCLRHFRNSAGCSKAQALETVTLHPAKALNIHTHKGSLDFGKDADLVILNDDFEVKSTWIAGVPVYGQK